jgi:hypothetical protein
MSDEPRLTDLDTARDADRVERGKVALGLPPSARPFDCAAVCAAMLISRLQAAMCAIRG